MHVLPQLRKLEEKFRDSLVVIGVHSAKFEAEKSIRNVAEAVRRYDVRHPVVNDPRFEVWQSYAVRAWPTLMFIDPQGKVIGKHEGEFPLEGLERVISGMVEEFEAEGWIRHQALPFQEIAQGQRAGTLYYPGKVEVDGVDGRLFIADSGNHRVVVSSIDGEVSAVIGSGIAGMAEGGFEDAVFDNPQGMAFHDELLFVADAGTHTIRAIDMEAKTVRTIAGTGEQSLYRHEGGAPLKNPLNSPYDLAVSRGVLYIAMAGFHQLWSLDVQADAIHPFAGNGAEGIKDGLRMDAMLAQPYGVAAIHGDVFFADSETSAVRVARSGEGGRVVTLVGTGLFDFGDADGVGKEARLQHVQGVAMGSDVVYVADTYNNKIKQIALGSLRVTTIAGSGEVGAHDAEALQASFNEPAGLAFDGRRLYVADTNNHAIRVLQLESGQVDTLRLRGA